LSLRSRGRERGGGGGRSGPFACCPGDDASAVRWLHRAVATAKAAEEAAAKRGARAQVLPAEAPGGPTDAAGDGAIIVGSGGPGGADM